jgi:hypothetical protein
MGLSGSLSMELKAYEPFFPPLDNLRLMFEYRSHLRVLSHLQNDICWIIF